MLCAATLGVVVFVKVILIDQKSPVMAFVVALTIFGFRYAVYLDGDIRTQCRGDLPGGSGGIGDTDQNWLTRCPWSFIS